MRVFTLALTIPVIFLLSGCEEPTPPAPPGGTMTAASTAADEAPETPTPPLYETFEKEPQLSLFPRVGDFQPPRGDERHPFWETFIDHLTRTSGLSRSPDEPPNHAWSFRSINTIDSAAFFAPVAVEPQTGYTVSFRMQTDLPEGASAGGGILEFDQFLWVGEQFTEETQQEHLSAPPTVGVTLEGKHSLDELQQFTITTGPQTRMLHLVFFREGEHSRQTVLLDDISITQAKNE